jgi:hypothetical protein
MPDSRRMPAAVLIANWVPNPAPDFGANPTPYIVLMFVGFVIGVFGHLAKSKTLIALGIGFIFLATFVLPLATNALKS